VVLKVLGNGDLRAIEASFLANSPQIGQVTMSDFWAPLPSLPMSPREQLVVCMFCEGMRVSEVAESLGLTIFTVKSYIKKARQRYANAGRPATNVLVLRQRLVEDGHLAY
jgi:DNA-binding NarL/FixJ family response regulator